MLDHCANPQCAKPLRYLREGRIFVFDSLSTTSDGAKRPHRLEHYWLCGECSRTLLLEKTPQEGVRLGIKPDQAHAFVHASQARAS